MDPSWVSVNISVVTGLEPFFRLPIFLRLHPKKDHTEKLKRVGDSSNG